MPNGVDHEFIHWKFTKFIKEMYQLAMERETNFKKASLPPNIYRKQAKKSTQLQISAISYRKNKQKG